MVSFLSDSKVLVAVFSREEELLINLRQNGREVISPNSVLFSAE